MVREGSVVGGFLGFSGWDVASVGLIGVVSVAG